MSHKHSANGETGRTFEEGRLFPQGDPRLKELRHLSIDYTPYRQAMEQVLINPLGYKTKETFDPPSEWMRDVHYQICQKLHLQDWSALKVFPALGTAADKWHGIDAVIQYTDPETKEAVNVTIDFTLNKSKEDGYKADIIITDTGARAHEEYKLDLGFDIPDMEHASKAEDQVLEAKRRDATATIIAKIIKAKIGHPIGNDTAKKDTKPKPKSALSLYRKRLARS